MLALFSWEACEPRQCPAWQGKMTAKRGELGPFNDDPPILLSYSSSAMIYTQTEAASADCNYRSIHKFIHEL